MATTKQVQAAQQNIKKARAGAEKRRSIANLPAKTRTALGKQGAAVAQRKRTGGKSPKTRQELYDEAKRRNLPGRSKMGRAGPSSPAPSATTNPPSKEPTVPDKRPSVKNEEQYEALKDKGMSKERAAKIANSPGASKKGGEESHSGSGKSQSKQGGTTAQKKEAGRRGGRATARKS